MVSVMIEVTVQKTIGEIISEPRHKLTPQHEVELLLSHVLNCRRIDLYLNREKILPPEISGRFDQLLEKRGQGIPLQYLINEAWFFGLKFMVGEGVFIPRPETEVLVERIINEVKGYNRKALKILELCTGCGNIAVALTKNLPNCRILATDINAKAIETAEKNAKLHQVDKRISFLHADLYAGLNPNHLAKQKFDIIIANPPYISRDEFYNLPLEVQHEPKAALDGGPDGLEFYRSIVSESISHLNKGGFIAFEFGDNQKQGILRIITETNSFEKPEFFSDLNKIDRFVMARKR